MTYQPRAQRAFELPYVPKDIESGPLKHFLEEFRQSLVELNDGIVDDLRDGRAKSTVLAAAPTAADFDVGQMVLANVSGEFRAYYKNSDGTLKYVPLVNMNAEHDATKIQGVSVDDSSATTSPTEGDNLRYRTNEWISEAFSADTTLAGDTIGAPGANTTTDLTLTSEAQGTINYFNGTNWVVLGVGTADYFLQTKGAAANPEWAEVVVPPTAGTYAWDFDQSVASLTTTNGVWNDIPIHNSVGPDTVRFYKEADQDSLDSWVNVSGGDGNARIRLEFDGTTGGTSTTINGSNWFQNESALDISGLSTGWHVAAFQAQHVSGGASTVILYSCSLRLSE